MKWTHKQKYISSRLIILAYPYPLFVLAMYYEFAVIEDWSNFYGFLCLGTAILSLSLLAYLEDMLKKFKEEK